jgi:hypothetical protein
MDEYTTNFLGEENRVGRALMPGVVIWILGVVIWIFELIKRILTNEPIGLGLVNISTLENVYYLLYYVVYSWSLFIFFLFIFWVLDRVTCGLLTYVAEFFLELPDYVADILIDYIKRAYRKTRYKWQKCRKKEKNFSDFSNKFIDFRVEYFKHCSISNNMLKPPKPPWELEKEIYEMVEKGKMFEKEIESFVVFTPSLISIKLVELLKREYENMTLKEA